MSLASESYVVRRPGGPITLETVHYDKIGEREILVETVAVSPPMILGHEGPGIVRQVGAMVAGVPARRRGRAALQQLQLVRDAARPGTTPTATTITELDFGCPILFGQGSHWAATRSSGRPAPSSVDATEEGGGGAEALGVAGLRLHDGRGRRAQRVQALSPGASFASFGAGAVSVWRLPWRRGCEKLDLIPAGVAHAHHLLVRQGAWRGGGRRSKH
ncbi:hypothetical protein VM1G_11974 [Cytospora mali]|uniref:Uncharacterized protein n=1 Tax=Cytospora mali TaxID=578113 RepID=A0A194WDV5_CYTMA|nr:hypothetical protein VM1G_11974 [Valsa mali]